MELDLGPTLQGFPQIVLQALPGGFPPVFLGLQVGAEPPKVCGTLRTKGDFLEDDPRPAEVRFFPPRFRQGKSGGEIPGTAIPAPLGLLLICLPVGQDRRFEVFARKGNGLLEPFFLGEHLAVKRPGG